MKMEQHFVENNSWNLFKTLKIAWRILYWQVQDKNGNTYIQSKEYWNTWIDNFNCHQSHFNYYPKAIVDLIVHSDTT